VYSIVPIVALVFLSSAMFGSFDAYQNAHSRHTIREFAMAHMDVSCRPPAPCVLLYRIDGARGYTYGLDPGGELTQNLLTAEYLAHIDRVKESRDYWSQKSSLALTAASGGVAMKVIDAIVDTKKGWFALKALVVEQAELGSKNPVALAERVFAVVAGLATGYYVGDVVGGYFGKLDLDSPAVVMFLEDPAEWKVLRQLFFARRVSALARWRDIQHEDSVKVNQGSSTEQIGVAKAETAWSRIKNVDRTEGIGDEVLAQARAEARLVELLPPEGIRDTSSSDITPDLRLASLLVRSASSRELAVSDYELLDRAEADLVSSGTVPRSAAGLPNETSALRRGAVVGMALASLIVMLCASGAGLVWLYKAFRRQPAPDVSD
jgi:hypothetical protein